MEEPDKPGKDGNDSKWFAMAMRYSAIGFNFAGSVLILGYVGYKIDENYGWSPWGLFGGLMAGMALGLYAMIVQLKKLER